MQFIFKKSHLHYLFIYRYTKCQDEKR